MDEFELALSESRGVWLRAQSAALRDAAERARSVALELRLERQALIDELRARPLGNAVLERPCVELPMNSPEVVPGEELDKPAA